MSPELSIAIVLYNSSASLSECLRSIRAAVDSGWADVVAVDNASPDDSVAVLRRELPEAQLVQFTENSGFAAGANEALAHATGRYWLLLNPDVKVPEGGLEALVTWMDRNPQVGVASPELIDSDGNLQTPGRPPPSIARAVLELSRVHRLLPRRIRGQVLRGPYWRGGDQFDAGWVPGTAMIVRPSAAKQVGLLRADMFMYGEDIEWCCRIRRAGWGVGVCSTTVFTHATGSSARRSWGSFETERRMAEGVNRAHRILYGSAHAHGLAAATALSLCLEAAAPGRQAEHRRRMRRAAKTWWRLATKG